MNRDEILEFAKDVWGRDKLDKGRDNQFDFYVDLVRAAMAKEREECARVAERFLLMHSGSKWDADHCAAAIRARGEE